MKWKWCFRLKCPSADGRGKSPNVGEWMYPLACSLTAGDPAACMQAFPKLPAPSSLQPVASVRSGLPLSSAQYLPLPQHLQVHIYSDSSALLDSPTWPLFVNWYKITYTHFLVSGFLEWITYPSNVPPWLRVLTRAIWPPHCVIPALL